MPKKKPIRKTKKKVPVNKWGYEVNLSPIESPEWQDPGVSRVVEYSTNPKLPTGKSLFSSDSEVKKEPLCGKDITERGRVLDRLIAKEVLGWDISTQPHCGCNPILMGIGIITANSEELVWGTPPGGEEKLIPLFSTSDHAAIDLYKEVRKKNFFCCVTISSDYDYAFDVAIVLPGYLRNDTKHAPSVRVYNTSLALALSVAFLEAVRLFKRLEKDYNEFRNKLKPGTAGKVDLTRTT